jgi:hypothetical protein
MEQIRKGGGAGYSASGANLDIPEMTPKALGKHWGGASDHSRQYPGLDKTGYAKKAVELARSPVGGDIRGYRGDDGCIVRYNVATNDWIKAHETGVDTMFKPKRGIEYYEENMIEDGGSEYD